MWLNKQIDLVPQERSFFAAFDNLRYGRWTLNAGWKQRRRQREFILNPQGFGPWWAARRQGYGSASAQYQTILKDPHTASRWSHIKPGLDPKVWAEALNA
jgi:hypothetical protein